MSEGHPVPVRPEFDLYIHCEAAGNREEAWRSHAEAALTECLAQEKTGSGNQQQPLAELDRIEISLVSDETIAAIHGEFMNDSSPTDVITFPHGEILISAETAARCASRHGHSPEREALLYLIHGLLHLNGYDDADEAGRMEMDAFQNRILDTVSPFPTGRNQG